MRILYISGSFGLGHVTRDQAIAGSLRARAPDLDIVWLAGEPASSVLRQAGERLHPMCADYRGDTEVADRVTSRGRLNLLTYAFAVWREWLAKALLVRRLLASESFDVVLADEAYELAVAQIVHLFKVRSPFVMMYDFLGLDATTGRWPERLGVYLWNFVWSRDGRLLTRPGNRGVFIGEPEDVADSRFGPLLPSRRAHALSCYEFVGYVLPFDPAGVADRTQLRRELGYGPQPLVVCAVGGTSTGERLLELCGQAYRVLSRMMPDLHMVLVCGPNIEPGSLHLPSGLDVRGFVPNLYKHFAASDLAIVQGGGTTTVELTALRRPFLFFPVEGQCEQEITIANRLARHRAGTRMTLSSTTPAELAEAVQRALGTTVTTAPVPIDGAARVAQLVLDLGRRQPYAGARGGTQAVAARQGSSRSSVSKGPNPGNRRA